MDFCKILVVFLSGVFWIYNLKVSARARGNSYDDLDEKTVQAIQNYLHLFNEQLVEPYIDGDELVDFSLALTLMKEEMRNSGSRKKRVALNGEINPSLLWPNSVIYYRFEPGKYDDIAKSRVRQAMDRIESETCFRFEPVADDFKSNHLIFQRKSSCISFVGRSQTIPQPLILSSSCLAMEGEIMHYLLHAMGMWHTHQREDRDSKVLYKAENTKPESQQNFNKIPSIFTKGLGTEYDFTSLMHYHGLKESIDGVLLTLQTLEPWYQRTIGQRAELSFYDKLLVNKCFCADRCNQIINCVNEGYLDPNSCSEERQKCKCPDGFSGDDCSIYPSPPKGPDTCGGVVELYLSDISKEISSPGYNEGRYYSEYQECTWLIKLMDANGQIEFKFEDKFGVFCHISKTCYHWVEVRYKSDLTKLGVRFCCDDPSTFADWPSLSENGEMMVIFKSNYPAVPTSRVGFKMVFHPKNFILCPVDFTCPENQFCNPQTGKCDPCPTGFHGEGCRQDINECAHQSHTCANGATCVNTKGSYYCECTPGYGDILCDKNINECDSEPCENGAVCEDLVAGYRCVCSDQYSGINCQIKVETTTTTVPTTSTTLPTSTTTSTPETSSSSTVPSTTSTSTQSSTTSSTTASTSTTMSTTSTTTSTASTTTSTASTTSTTTSTTSTTSTTPSKTSSSTTKSTTTTDQFRHCPEGYWGENCNCPLSKGGFSALPGDYAQPCCSDDELECIQIAHYKRVRTCTSILWFQRCTHRYTVSYSKVCVCGRQGKCYPGNHLFVSKNIYYCGKKGYSAWTSECTCCLIHCSPGCEGDHVKRMYYDFKGDYNNPDALEYYHQYHCFSQTCDKKR